MCEKMFMYYPVLGKSTNLLFVWNRNDTVYMMYIGYSYMIAWMLITFYLLSMFTVATRRAYKMCEKMFMYYPVLGKSRNLKVVWNRNDTLYITYKGYSYPVALLLIMLPISLNIGLFGAKSIYWKLTALILHKNQFPEWNVLLINNLNLCYALKTSLKQNQCKH